MRDMNVQHFRIEFFEQKSNKGTTFSAEICQGYHAHSVCVNEIEDEYHFLFECEKNKALRKEFCRKITPLKENFVTMNNSKKVQFLFNLSSLSEIEKGTTCDDEFSKFVCQSFKVIGIRPLAPVLNTGPLEGI